MSEAMCPRVDVEALDKRATLHQLQVSVRWLVDWSMVECIEA